MGVRSTINVLLYVLDVKMADPSNLHNSGFGSQRFGLGHAVNHVGGNNLFGGSTAGFRIGGELRHTRSGKILFYIADPI